MYTNSKQADKQIAKDIEIIKKIILKELNLSHIILFGGFGHSGGSFKKTKNKIIPLNDYDMYLVSKKPISDEKLERLGEICSKALGKGGIEIVENFNQKYDEEKFFHVDLHYISPDKLKTLYPTQRTFDLKTSIVVYGNKSILNLVPDVKPSKSDAFRLLFNKIDHFAIAENNQQTIKNIYAVKGFTDLCSAILIWEGKYTSRYQDREKIFQTLKVPEQLKKLVKKATDAKLNKGYKVDKNFFNESKKWVEWTLKTLIKKYLNIKSNNWPTIAKIMYKKLPYVYFNSYLKSKMLFPAQYYLNLKFFNSALRKNEFLPKSILKWRDAGLTIAIALILYSYNHKREAEKYLRKLTNNTSPLRDRILKLYSIYYLQKLV